MTVRLRKALDTAKEYRASQPEVEDILKYWGSEFKEPCPYNPKEVKISKDKTKTLLVPQQQAANYESRAAIFESSRGGASTTELKSMSITRMPKKGTVLKQATIVDEDTAVLQIRLALLAASQREEGEEAVGGVYPADTAPASSEIQPHPPSFGAGAGGVLDSHKEGTAPQRLKNLVRGTRTTLLQLKEKKRAEERACNTPIAVTRGSRSFDFYDKPAPAEEESGSCS